MHDAVISREPPVAERVADALSKCGVPGNDPASILFAIEKSGAQELISTEPGLVMEGGSIDVNGAGVVMTTEQCLLHPNRNPGRSKGEIERALRDFLGVSEVLWLGEGVAGDDTDGHIDDIARFVSETTIVTVVEDESRGPKIRVIKKKRRKGMRRTKGHRAVFTRVKVKDILL